MNEHEINSTSGIELINNQNSQIEFLLQIALPVFIIKRDKFSRYILHSYNEFAQDIFAVPLDRLINKEIRIFWPKESWDDFRKGIISSIRKGAISNVESIQIEKEGRIRSFNLRIWKLDDSTACCIFCETIDRKYFIQSVLNERLKYEELFKNTPVMMTNITLDGKIIDANQYWLDKTGYTRDELIGANVGDFFIKESTTLLMTKSFSELILTNELINVPVQMRKKYGDNLSVVITTRALFDLNGKFIRCYLVAHDITDLEEIKEESKAVESLLKTLFDTTEYAILMLSPQKGILNCNHKAELILGADRNSIISKHISELDFFVHAKSNNANIKKFFKKEFDSLPEKFELELNDGNKKRFVEIKISKINLRKEPYYLFFLTDKSREKIQNKKSQKNEKVLEILFEESIDALRLMDKDGRIIDLNKKAKEWFSDFIDRNGFVKINYKGFDYQEWFNNFIASDERSTVVEYRLKLKNNYKVIKESLSKILLESGDTIIFSKARDITSEKIAEEQLRKNEKRLRELNESKNRLIYILSHDLRAPTSSIIGIVSAILDEPELELEELKNYLRLIRSAGSYQLDLINNLLDWSLIESGKFNYTIEPKNLEYAVYNSLNSIRGLLEQKEIKLKVKIDSELVLIDLNLFSRIIINLVSNAVKFSFPKGRIWINSRKLSNDKIQISIKDTGIGFDKEVLDKIFTSREKISRRGTAGERGTGLGLTLCKDMIELLGGKLHIESPLKNSGKSKGSIVSFEMQRFQPKILLSKTFDKTIFNDINKEFNKFKILSKEIHKYFNDGVDDYFVFIIIHENDIRNSLLNKIEQVFKTKKNIIVVTNKSESRYADLKSIELQHLIPFLKNEFERIEFEWKQQENIARQMKKMWA